MWMFNFKNDLDTSSSWDKVHDVYVSGRRTVNDFV